MTTDLAFTVFRIGFLVLLWLLVLAAVNTLRRDIFGTVVTPRGKGRDKATSRRKASRDKRKDKKRTSSNPLAPKDLLVTGGPLVGTMLPLGEAPIVIGRSPACTLVLEDEYASSRHAALTPPVRWLVDRRPLQPKRHLHRRRTTEHPAPAQDR